MKFLTSRELILGRHSPLHEFRFDKSGTKSICIISVVLLKDTQTN